MKVILFVVVAGAFVLAVTLAEISSRKKDLAKQKFEGKIRDEVGYHGNEIVKEVKPVIWRLVTNQNHDGETPIHIAAKNGNVALINAVLPLVVRHPGLLKEMLDLKNNDGKTALELAEKAGHSKVVTKIKNLMDTDHYKI